MPTERNTKNHVRNGRPPTCEVYPLLVRQRNDLVGVIAYCLYKEKKKNFFEKYRQQYRREPNDDELRGFFEGACTPESVEAFRSRASETVEVIIKAITSKMAEDKARAFLHANISEELKTINKKLHEQRTIGGLSRDAIKEIVSNVAAIFIVGMLMFGYQGMQRLSDAVQHAALPQPTSTSTNTDSSTPPKATSAPPSP